MIPAPSMAIRLGPDRERSAPANGARPLILSVNNIHCHLHGKLDSLSRCMRLQMNSAQQYVPPARPIQRRSGAILGREVKIHRYLTKFTLAGGKAVALLALGRRIHHFARVATHPFTTGKTEFRLEPVLRPGTGMTDRGSRLLSRMARGERFHVPT